MAVQLYYGKCKNHVFVDRIQAISAFNVDFAEIKHNITVIPLLYEVMIDEVDISII